MNYRRLGKSGLKVSEISFGSWVTFSDQLNVDQALACMTAAYDAGCNFFDNAEVYAAGQSEVVMGEALKKVGWSRDSYIVSSKVFFGAQSGDPKPTQRGLSRKHVLEACHQALKRLQVDYLDLYFCHRPDRETPIEETVRAMTELILRGDILYWGTSEWTAPEIMEAYSVAREYGLIPPTMEQPQYNLLHRQRVEQEYERLYEVIGLGTTIFSPLATGFLTGRYNNGIPADGRANLPGYEWLKARLEGPTGEARLAAIRQWSKIADELGTSLSHLALAWCLKNPNVSTVIMGASRPEQVVENMKAVDVLPLLTDEVMKKIASVSVAGIEVD
ncbi:MAG TPA: aldo/keto reductase [Anaerolineales bacterium]|nr:aldo/keto reductase [Anaerolineales bacterium]HND50125.1 aldo/keto reductase [Anaerolineales bacterium]